MPYRIKENKGAYTFKEDKEEASDQVIQPPWIALQSDHIVGEVHAEQTTQSHSQGENDKGCPGIPITALYKKANGSPTLTFALLPVQACFDRSTTAQALVAGSFGLELGDY